MNWKSVIVLVVVIATLMVSPAITSAGEKEEIAIKVFTIQEEVATLQEQFKGKQAAFVKLREGLKKQADHAQKGKDAVKLMEIEAELIALNDRIKKKDQEYGEARAKFRELVDKEVKK